MEKEPRIRTLTQRFFDGETTLAEEWELYQLYQRPDVPADLLPCREMFAGYQTVMPRKAARTADGRFFRKRLARLAVAASLAAAVVAGASLYRQYQHDNECVAIIYGKKYTDEAVVMAEMRRNADSMVENVVTDEDIAAQLGEIFHPEEE